MCTEIAAWCCSFFKGVLLRKGDWMIRLLEGLAPGELATNFGEIVEDARDAAEKVDDIRLKAGALAVVASVSGLPDDLSKALDFASVVGRNSMQAELLAVIAKTLAEAGKIDQARETALRIKDMDAYWCVEALLHVGRIGRQKSDFNLAEELAARIRDGGLRLEALADIRGVIAETADPSRNGHNHHGNRHIQAEALTGIVKTLVKLRGLKDARLVASRISSAYWRAKAYAAIASGLAEAIK